MKDKKATTSRKAYIGFHAIDNSTKEYQINLFKLIGIE